MERVYVPTKPEIVIYAAGKTWMAPEFRKMRNHGFNVNSSWIDIEHVLSDPNDTYAPEIHENTEFLGEIWDNGCKQDCNSADLMILACAPVDGNLQSGALVELGHVTGEPHNKPCYIIGTCASVEPAGDSDRAWKYQSNVYYWPEYFDVENYKLDCAGGFSAAVRHYRANYAPQWNQRRIESERDNLHNRLKAVE